MEPTPTNIAVYMFPTAVCTPNPLPEVRSSLELWSQSTLNPKNRIDSFELLPAQTWKIDGGNLDGTRFYAIPNFARGRPPLRIYTYIPEIENTPEHLRDTLQTNSSMFLESHNIASSNISRHVLRALEHWSVGFADFEKEYSGMPFGSRIIFENMAADVRDVKIHFVPVFHVERQYLSQKGLQNLWNLSEDSWPESLDFEKLQFQQQIDDNISLVSLAGKDGEYIFKSLTDDLKHFYHELRLLLTIDPHPNIISRPLYVVTKKCAFGGKLGICGLILEYHRAGGLRTIMRQRSSNLERELGDEISWAQQITSALIHIKEKGAGFYTNLKLDNIVMASSGDAGALRPVLIDFEQRLGSPVWTPPEVHYIVYLTNLATKSPEISFRKKYTHLLQINNIPISNPSKSARYDNPKNGYCEPWSSFTLQQQESAQVYMLGKLLWCLFENGTVLNTHISISSFREGSEVADIVFPNFRRTPQKLRECIMRCTAGAQETRGHLPPLVIRDRKIFARDWKGGPGPRAVEEAQTAARRWWRQEIADAERFLETRKESGNFGGSVQNYIEMRPTLKEVLNVLQSL